jgi:RNA polymerase sigma-70 factor (ECF subfamily)
VDEKHDTAGPAKISLEMQKFREGDKKAVERLYHFLRPILCQTIRRKFPECSLSEIDDAVDDVLFRVISRREYLPAFRTERQFAHYCFVAARNRMYEQRRKLAKFQDPAKLASIERPSPANDLSVEEDVRAAVEQAFEELDPKERLVVDMLLRQQRSQKDIAEKLGISAAAVSRMHCRALAKIRAVIEERGIDL